MRKVQHALVFTLTLSTILVGGCGKHAKEMLKEIEARNAKPIDPFHTDAIAKAAAELEAQLGAPVRALDVEISNHHIVFQVQDPKKPENVDAYELRNGVFLAPRPVQLMGEGSLEANLYALAEVPLGDIPRLVEDALEAVELENGKVSSLRIHRRFSGIPASAQAALEKLRRRAGTAAPKSDMEEGAIAVEIYVDSPRRKGYALADERFEIVRTNLF